MLLIVPKKWVCVNCAVNNVVSEKWQFNFGHWCNKCHWDYEIDGKPNYITHLVCMKSLGEEGLCTALQGVSEETCEKTTKKPGCGRRLPGPDSTVVLDYRTIVLIKYESPTRGVGSEWICRLCSAWNSVGATRDCTRKSCDGIRDVDGYKILALLNKDAESVASQVQNEAD
jgi:hypothetical protein